MRLYERLNVPRGCLSVISGKPSDDCHEIAQITPPGGRDWGVELRCSRGLVGGRPMEMFQTLDAQLAMMMFFALMPMLGMLQARRARHGEI